MRECDDGPCCHFNEDKHIGNSPGCFGWEIMGYCTFLPNWEKVTQGHGCGQHDIDTVSEIPYNSKQAVTFTKNQKKISNRLLAHSTDRPLRYRRGESQEKDKE